jgi:nitrate reductase NapE component
MSENGKTQGAPAKEPNKGRKRISSRAKVTIGVIVAVVLVGGFGFYQWHETPQFCGAICHEPMDMYLVNYTDGEYDAYGNQMKSAVESSAMMAYMHKQVNNQTCLQCHQAALEEQITEGVSWITHGYEIAGTNSLGYTYMHDAAGDSLVKYRSVTADQFCLVQGCHTDTDGNAVMTRADLTAATADMGTMNPHQFDKHYATWACTDCHKGHSQSVNMCTDCHDDAPVPAGWLTVEEREQIEAKAFGGEASGPTRTAAEAQAAAQAHEALKAA